MSNKKEVVESFKGIKDFCAGAMGGVGLLAVGHPFDTIKVRMQTASVQRSLMETVKLQVKEFGPLGFYRGALSPLVGLSAMNSVLFWGFNLTVRKFRKDGDVSKLTIPQVMAAGGVGGFACAFIEGPMDLFKCKMQSGLTDATGSFSCARDILKNYGIRGLLQGHTASIIRNVPSNLFYFMGYEWAKRKFTGGDSSKASGMQILMSGGIGGFCYWAFNYPCDVFKSIMQSQPSDPTKRQYKNYLQCVKGTFAEQGFKGLYKGFVPCMLRSFPANAACFYCYEITRKLLKKIG